ncbi:MAG: hypothetical protein MRK00_16355 [Nitrosomonas sp.]|nr:hypothetical protein [Nitrosomonas sp.]
MPIPALYAMAVAVILGAGFAGGYTLSSKIAAGNLKQCELDKSTMLLGAEREASERMQVAEESTQNAFAYAMNRIIDAEQQAEELRNEAKNHTTGRDCLSGNARRVLEQSAAFEQQRVPKNTRSADTTVAGTAEDTRNRATTDADIADWIATVSGLYDQCRGRVEAIAEWDNGMARR